MSQVVIENPILNSPFDPPARHFAFDENGITDREAAGRRRSGYFVPIARPRKQSKQMTFDDFVEEPRQNDDVNYVRTRVDLWRERGYPGTTPTTRALLAHWSDPGRERRLFFCQVEALETLIYLNEAAEKSGDLDPLQRLRQYAGDAGTPLLRQACKMATGSGKTVVMSMIVAWHALNKASNPRDKRFTDSFLVVTPGITIRDRLRVLLPADAENYYRKLDLVPAEQFAELSAARIVVTNYHAFKRREFGDAGKLTKEILRNGRPNPFVESPEQMVRRVWGKAERKEILVLNDEAHHCYRARPGGEKLTGDERKEAQERDEAARLWITGLEAVHDKIGVKAVFDLSATPFYLKGSGYPEGTLFPWVVSDFSLIDAIESGVVKIPRVPVADDTLAGDLPTYLGLWPRIRDQLPKKRSTAVGPPQLPKELEGALHSLYSHYDKEYRRWAADAEGRELGLTPPVFIVVCSNTAVSKLVYEWIAGHETGATHPDGAAIVAAGSLAAFSNVEGDRWLPRPYTILVDSQQLESGEGMRDDFRKIAAAEIALFQQEYRLRNPGADADSLTDEDVMREVMNTVGKPGKLGEGVRCVVSVSMLTEGWDVNTVTHILGVRAFGTQLLCEQVIGRGLRRRSYSINENGHFDREYAEVYGVPFAFLPCAGSLPEEREKRDEPRPGNIKAIPERAAKYPWVEIRFPRLVGYRHETPAEVLGATFSEQSRLVLSTHDVPSWTESAPIVGESVIHRPDDLRQRREQEVEFALARRVLATYFRADDPEGGPGGLKAWLFPQLLEIVRRWRRECLDATKDDVFLGMLLMEQWSHSAAEKIHRAIVAASPGGARVRAVLQADAAEGTTADVSFPSSRDRYRTREDRCHVNFATLDSRWEGHFAQSLESMDEVRAYVKNQNLGFRIPYVHEGRSGWYYPDYLVRVDDGGEDLLTLIVELSGQKREEKEAKVDTAKTLWVPAVNGEGRYGRWGYVEIDDPHRAKAKVREYLAAGGAILSE